MPKAFSISRNLSIKLIPSEILLFCFLPVKWKRLFIITMLQLNFLLPDWANINVGGTMKIYTITLKDINIEWNAQAKMYPSWE